MKSLPISTIILIFILSCTQSPKNTEIPASELGDMGYTFELSDTAKEAFNKGFLLLHSFEYDDAREEFRAAQQADPTEVMPYWGVAMSHYKALWGLQNLEEGRKVIAEFGGDKEERLAKIEDPIEKAFWQGVEILYGEGELKERNQKYVDHMEEIYKQHPSNQEVAAFLSLGLMWADYNNSAYLKRSSKIAERILASNPTHPGALHYMIHANDNPENAEHALQVAHKYAKVAPAAAHALHMPSHIYVALGMWNESVASNIDSYQASLSRVERKELSGKDRGYHSMAWLHYSHLQKGQFIEATELLAEMQSYYQDSTHSDFYLIMMQNNQFTETGEWPSDLSVVDVDYNNLGLEGKSSMHFLKSNIALQNKDSKALLENINALGKHIEAAKLELTDEGVALCSSGPTRYAPTKSSIDRTQVVLHQMQSMYALLTDNKAEAEKQLQLATTLEAKCGYDPGPPFIAYPSFEQYGDFLLEQGRAEEALKQFNNCLAGRNYRAKSLKGKLAALNSLGMKKEARAVQKTLNTFYSNERIASL